MNDKFTCIVTDIQQIDTGTVFPCEIVKPPVLEVAVAEFIIVYADTDLRERSVKFFEPFQSAFGGGILIAPVNSIVKTIWEKLWSVISNFFQSYACHGICRHGVVEFIRETVDREFFHNAVLFCTEDIIVCKAVTCNLVNGCG